MLPWTILDALSAETLRAMWDDYAHSLLQQGSVPDPHIGYLNAIALALGRKRGAYVFVSGRNGEVRCP